MVFLYSNNAVSPHVTYLVGEDKYENEELIKWGWPEDVWFHVDKLPSAHVYLRLQPGETIKDIPPEVLEDACQLTKANSAKANKLNDIDVVYTMWSNLKKRKDMEVGQVTFHSEDLVYKFKVEKRKNDVIRRLDKTKKQEKLDLRASRERRDAEQKEKSRQLLKLQKEKEKVEEQKRKEEADLRSYSSLMRVENMTANDEQSGYDSDDFM